MLIIGIDPGISGAICFFENGEVKDIIDMPVMADGKKNKKQINGSQIYNEIFSRTKNHLKKDIHVVIEQVSAMPGQGVTSMFNFGQSFGVVKGICSAMQLSMYFVRPLRWKKYFNLIKKYKGKPIGCACLIDRSNKNKFLLKFKLISQLKLNIPTYYKKKLPDSLKKIRITKPGSRFI